jgi:phosphatidylethanolamine-binding protein (PEBP) family uncharacterized protein
MVSLLDDDIEQQGELSISAADFADGDRMPDYVGYANENENPRLAIDGVPDAAASLVLVVDDPDAKSVVGFTFDHWLTWDIDPGIDAIPRSWTPNAEETTVGYNDFVEANYSGPSPRTRRTAIGSSFSRSIRNSDSRRKRGKRSST